MKDIPVCFKQNHYVSAILDIHIHREICVTSQQGKIILRVEGVSDYLYNAQIYLFLSTPIFTSLFRVTWW